MLRRTAWLTHHHVRSVSLATQHNIQHVFPPVPPCTRCQPPPSIVSSPRGCRRSRASHSGSRPRRESLHHASEEVDESTPFRCSRLSGMGDSDCAESACRIARLSLRLVSSLSVPLYSARDLLELLQRAPGPPELDAGMWGATLYVFTNICRVCAAGTGPRRMTRTIELS